MPPLPEIAATFFEIGHVRCLECGADVDVWSALLGNVRDEPGPLSVASLGASSTFFMFTLRRHQFRDVDFAVYGVPGDAVILGVSYTPQGVGCFPVEVKGNSARAPLIGTKVSVYGLPLGDRDDGDIRIAAWVAWVHEKDNSEPWIAIADALESLALQRNAHAVLSAHVAVEISVSRVIRDVARKYASQDRVNQFMRDTLTASAAINVIFPMICGQEGVPQLRDEIRGRLNELRNVRNEVVHEGRTNKEIEARTASELVCAAVFGFEYARYVRQRLLSTEGD